MSSHPQQAGVLLAVPAECTSDADGPPAWHRDGKGSRQEQAARELIARQDDGGLNDAIPS